MKQSSIPSHPAAALAQEALPKAHQPGQAVIEIGSIPPSTLVDAHTTALYLGVTAATLSVWRSTGRYALPFVKCGSKVRYRVGDLLDFIERRTRTHT